MIILILILIIILLCISLYFLKANRIEFYTTQETAQETGQKQNKKNKCVTITPFDPTNMDCGSGLYMQSILNIPGNSTQIKCCKIN